MALRLVDKHKYWSAMRALQWNKKNQIPTRDDKEK